MVSSVLREGMNYIGALKILPIRGWQKFEYFGFRKYLFLFFDLPLIGNCRAEQKLMCKIAFSANQKEAQAD